MALLEEAVLSRDTQLRTAASNVGRKVRWSGEPHLGTITKVVRGPGGWPRYIIDWQPGAPEWWSSSISTTSHQLIIEDEPC